MSTQLDVVGVGNAVVDVIANVSESFISEHDLTKGAMTLIDAERAKYLHGAMPPGIEIGGGSAANTMVGVAGFGGRAAFVGKLRDDRLGEVFADDLRASGVEFDVSLAAVGEPTARSLIQVTPDGERTMNTCLGISAALSTADISAETVQAAAIIYCEGYLYDTDSAKSAIRHVMDIASDAGTTVSITLSDPFCVERHRNEWLDLLADKVDLVFANEAEIAALFCTDDFEAATRRMADLVSMAAITRSEHGSVVVTGDQRLAVPASEVPNIVDATGAGDLYAAGFLYGYATGLPLQRCAELGSIAAGEVISHMGARPDVSLASLIS